MQLEPTNTIQSITEAVTSKLSVSEGMKSSVRRVGNRESSSSSHRMRQTDASYLRQQTANNALCRLVDSRTASSRPFPLAKNRGSSDFPTSDLLHSILKSDEILDRKHINLSDDFHLVETTKTKNNSSVKRYLSNNENVAIQGYILPPEKETTIGIINQVRQQNTDRQYTYAQVVLDVDNDLVFGVKVNFNDSKPSALSRVQQESHIKSTSNEKENVDVRGKTNKRFKTLSKTLSKKISNTINTLSKNTTKRGKKEKPTYNEQEKFAVSNKADRESKASFQNAVKVESVRDLGLKITEYIYKTDLLLNPNFKPAKNNDDKIYQEKDGKASVRLFSDALSSKDIAVLADSVVKINMIKGKLYKQIVLDNDHSVVGVRTLEPSRKKFSKIRQAIQNPFSQAIKREMKQEF